MWKIVMSALCTVLGLASAMLAAQSAPAKEPQPELLRVMSFNIRYSAARDSAANVWAQRKELVRETIRRFDPDLLGLQEVMADQFDALRELLPDYTAVGVARDDGHRQGEWSAIFYRTARFTARDSGTFWLSEQPDEVGSRSWDAACVRICTWVRLRDRVTGQQFLHANTHFDHRSRLARLRSAMLLNERLPMLARGGPIVLTGDFNATEHDEPYRVLVGGAPGGGRRFFDAYRQVHPERSRNEASFHGFKGKRAGSRIDWILHTAEFKAVAAEIVQTAAPPFASDHFAVTATLRPLATKESKLPSTSH